jgi:hypothetical protein
MEISPLNKELTRIHPRIDPKKEDPGLYIKLKNLEKKKFSGFQPGKITFLDNTKNPPEIKIQSRNTAAKSKISDKNRVQNTDYSPADSNIREASNQMKNLKNPAKSAKKIDIYA